MEITKLQMPLDFVTQSGHLLRLHDVCGGTPLKEIPREGGTGLKLSTSPVEIFWSGDHAGLEEAGQSMM